MYASIRRYKTSSAAEVTRRVNEGFVPRISNITGFLAYYVIDTGEGELATVSVFETKTGERNPTEWLQAGSRRLYQLSGGLLGPVEVTSGEVVAHKAK